MNKVTKNKIIKELEDLSAGNGKKISRHRMMIAAEQIMDAIAKDEKKSKVDAERDSKKRKLIGARIPIETANEIEAAAASMNLSVYAWVTKALSEKLQRERDCNK